ncbi:hypothetical protein L1987_08995 [Smallanthus sonchifolius]|uniref:Uncharacterized protein n=1 Tax=Smallanthus sonchifolius TaxID=185202 RepID=A0ACB9JPK3_9ASTR|nr:hypothetical protein L1987_08995 [Smallanthus sonchifolius]
MQMVDRLDEGIISPDLGALDYKGLYKAVGKALFRAHVEGQLKANSEIMSKPELFVRARSRATFSTSGPKGVW